MEKALITGGAGFIGSRLASRLIEMGVEVNIVDDLSRGIPRRVPEGARLWVSDISVSGIPREAAEGVDVVFHLAANILVHEGVMDRNVHFRNNVIGTKMVLDSMVRAGTDRIVFASSSAVYGEGGEGALPETGRLRPISHYGASKLAGEAFISSYGSIYGIRGYSMRLANVVGPGAMSGVVVALTRRALSPSRELVVLGDGGQRRGFVHVDDVVSAMIHVVEVDADPGPYNVGPGDSMTVLEVARTVLETLGVEKRIVTTGGRVGWRGDVRSIVLDVSKLMRTGWRPSMGSEEAVRETVKYLKGKLAEEAD